MTTSSELKWTEELDRGARITDEGIARLRARIGIEMPISAIPVPANWYAAVDAIRHYAYGLGDDNPLWCDPNYAKRTRWRNVIAPPTFLDSMGVSDVREVPPEAREKSRGALAGVHKFHSGDEWEWFLPIYPGDQVTKRRFMHSVDEKQSRFGGRSVVSKERIMYINQRRELVACWFSIYVHTERKTAAERGTNLNITRTHYTSEMIKEIDRAYDSEYVRGAEPRYWEDTNVGDEVNRMVKGPLTLSDMVGRGGGGGVGVFKLQFKRRKKHPRYYTLNSYGVPEVVERCHWDDENARQIGNPMAYDAGRQRRDWMVHCITNWMGDDAWLWKFSERLIQFNFLGDTSWVSGKVVNKHRQDEKHVVELSLNCVDQRGRTTGVANVSVLLPSREAGPVILPRPTREQLAQAWK